MTSFPERTGLSPERYLSPSAGKAPLMDAVTRVPGPYNEPVRQYQPGSAERSAVEAKIKDLAGQHAELTMTIGGRAVMGSGERVSVVQPHNHQRVLGEFGNAIVAAFSVERQGPARTVVRRPLGHLPARGGTARRPLALHAERGDDPRPVQVGVPGGDRRRVRDDRLLAVQRVV